MTKMPAADCNTKKPRTQNISVNVLVLQQHAVHLAPFCTTAVWLEPEVDQRPTWRGGKSGWILPLSLSGFMKVCYSFGVGLNGTAWCVFPRSHSAGWGSPDAEVWLWPHKTIATFQVVVMLISQLMVTSRWPAEGQLLHQFWCSSNPSVSCLRELRNLFTLYLWVSLLPLLLPELTSCGLRWPLVQGKQQGDMEDSTGPCLLLAICSYSSLAPVSNHVGQWSKATCFRIAYPQLQVLQWWKGLVAQSQQKLYVSAFSYETDNFRFFWKLWQTCEYSKLIKCGLVQICIMWLVDVSTSFSCSWHT